MEDAIELELENADQGDTEKSIDVGIDLKAKKMGWM